VSIADHIIEAGPFAEGQVLPPELVREVFKTARLNELRAELIAGRQARGLDGATPTIHTTMAELRSEKFWAERIATVAAAHGMETPDAIHNASGSGDPNLHMLKHPDGRVLLIIRTDQEGA
jgi:anthranilate phosphoribosyltransferase